MNYRHAYHAGNFADVAKHLALTAVCLHLRGKDKPFVVIDSHAGRGMYDLTGAAAAKTGEAADGIGRLRDLPGALPQSMRAYLALVAEAGEGAYPGSPFLAAKLLRAQDRLVAIEKHPEEAAALRAVLAPFAKAKVVQGDGYGRLAALMPPAERRGLVLIDPPFEAADEFVQAADAFAGAYRRFATGIYLLWFPVKSTAAADAFCGEILAAGVAKAVRLDIARPAAEGRLGAAGLLVVNPPFGFAAEMAAAGAILGPGLCARMAVRWLAGAD